MRFAPCKGARLRPGPHLNAYHGDTVNWLRSLGATAVLPFELSADEMKALIDSTGPDRPQAEVLVWGACLWLFFRHAVSPRATTA